MKHSVRYYIFKLKYVIAFCIFIVAITFFGESSLINRLSQQEEINELNTSINEYEQKFKQDEAMLKSLKSDPEALKKVARERYYMKTDDEDLFVIEDDEQ